MATPAEDEQSTLKRRARRRLIGAIALALVAVIVLPMVFDAEKKPLEADISIQIPNKDALVTKGPGAITAPALPTAPGAAGVPGASSESKESGTGKGVPEAEKKPAEKKSESKAQATADTKPDAKAGATAKAAEARNTKDLAEEKRAAAILNAQADAAAADQSAQAAKAAKTAKSAATAKAAGVEGGFAVQVGAFAADDKIKEARDKLAAGGIKTYTEKLDTKDGERTRVRAGPFTSREAAEAAREQIRAMGFSGANVVTR